MPEVLMINNTDVRLERKLDGKGRVVLPGDLREAVGMAADADVEIRLGTLQHMDGMTMAEEPAFIITMKEAGDDQGTSLYHYGEGGQP